jgi:soluble lytic murein transglycosylase-like protein
MNLPRIATWAVLGVVGYAYFVGGASSTTTVVGGNLNPAALPASAKPYISDIEQAGTVCPQITAALIAAQINQESGFDPGSESDTSAEGIAQFEPYNGLVTDGEVNPWNPASAIHGMAVLDCREAKHFGGSVTLALAAYNAGEGGASNWQNIGQTSNYVRSIEAQAPRYAGATTKTTTATTAPLPLKDVNQRIENGLNTLIGEL